MNRFVRTALVVVAMGLMGVSAVAAAGNPAQVRQAKVNLNDAPRPSADNELSGRHADFADFAKWKVRQLNSNHRLSRSRMEVSRQADGTYRGRYHEIDDANLSVQVRRSQSSSIPFVGVLSYREQVFESVASSPEKLQQSLFAVVQVIPNRHIFSYQKGRWN